MNYSQWMRSTVKDQGLAEEMEKVEGEDLDPKESRNRIFRAIRAKYTAPD